MSDQPNEIASEGEYQSADRSGAALGLALLFVGLAAGAIAALLLTPKTGKQMRRSLRRKYENAREVVDDWGEQAGDWIEKGSGWVEKGSGTGRRSQKPGRTTRQEIPPLALSPTLNRPR